MKKILVLIPLLILIQPAFADITIQNDQTYVGDDGVLHIVGEIENNSKTPLNKIKITATLTDENGNEIKRIDGKVMSNTLMPGIVFLVANISTLGFTDFANATTVDV